MTLDEYLQIHHTNTYVVINTGEPVKLKELYKHANYCILKDRKVVRVSLATFFDEHDLIAPYMFIKIC